MTKSTARWVLAACLLSCGRIGYDELHVAGAAGSAAGSSGSGGVSPGSGGNGTAGFGGSDGSAGLSGASGGTGSGGAATGGEGGSTAGSAGAAGQVGTGGGVGLGPGTIVTIGGRPDADFSGSADVYLVEISPNASYGGSGVLIMSGAMNQRQHGVLWFDLSPLDFATTITGAELRLFTNNNEFEDGALEVYELLEGFVEGEASWNQRAAGIAWTAPGAGPGSRADTLLASFSAIAPQTEYFLPLPASLVAGWVNAPSTNFGVAIVPTGTSVGQIYATQAASDARRPLLVVSYE